MAEVDGLKPQGLKREGLGDWGGGQVLARYQVQVQSRGVLNADMVAVVGYFKVASCLQRSDREGDRVGRQMG